MNPSPDDEFEDRKRAAHTVRVQLGRHRHGRPVFFGVALVGLGVLFLLDNLNIVEARDFFRTLWPLLLIAWGLSKVLFGRAGEKLFGVLAAAFGGLILGNRFLGWGLNVAGLFWPLLLIGLGLNMLFRPRRRRGFHPPFPPAPPTTGVGAPPPPPYASFGETTNYTGTSSHSDNVDESALLREVAIMAGIERRNVSQTFRGGTITAVMGSVEMDLRDCRMADDSATITVQAILGHVVLRLPPTWTVESRLAAVMGNLEDRSDRPVGAAPKRLIIEGSAFMGQVEIRN